MTLYPKTQKRREISSLSLVEIVNKSAKVSNVKARVNKNSLPSTVGICINISVCLYAISKLFESLFVFHLKPEQRAANSAQQMYLFDRRHILCWLPKRRLDHIVKDSGKRHKFRLGFIRGINLPREQTSKAYKMGLRHSWAVVSFQYLHKPIQFWPTTCSGATKHIHIRSK